MTYAEQLLEQVEGSGGALILDGERMRVRIPEDAAYLLDELRAHRDEVVLLLRSREEIPLMPEGVRLVRWEPKSPPVMLTHYAVVTNVHRFVSMTLLELKAAIAGKRWQSGNWSVRELLDKLEQCGVHMEIEPSKRRVTSSEHKRLVKRCVGDGVLVRDDGQHGERRGTLE